jgi:ribosomal protein S18 acetylase RimI-like enzyme
MAVVISATAAHASEIVRLIGVLREQEGLDEPVTPESVQAYLDDADTDVFVALGHETTEAAAPVIGVLSLRVMRDLFHGRPTALIQELVVAEGHRGEGIGGALLDAAIERARALGCVEIAVTTGEHNEAGQAAYRSRGFEQDGVYFERHFNG